jgi:catechol 2,3-dioxygenase-like lactoylglutathione lyase family enzyme
MEENKIGKSVVFYGVNPVFRVANLEASIAYYVDKLGFRVNWQYPTTASLIRGRTDLFLCEGDQGHPGAWIWIGVNDADALYAEFLASGAKIRHPPNNFAWALEMQVEDLDGNVLRLGSDTMPNRPPAEWLDMDGIRWKESAPSQWVRLPSSDDKSF